MSGRDRHERVWELLDGLLRPAEESCVRELVESDPGWRRRYREARAVHALLDTPLDVSPPVDLAPAVMKAVTTDRVRRVFRFRLPARVENTLVVTGTAALAALVLGGTRVVGADGIGWLGTGVVALVRVATGAVDRVVPFLGSFAHLDWAGRLLDTLSEAARTVLASSAQPLLTFALASVVLTALVAFVLVRTERGSREGGLRHAHLAL